MPVRPVTIVCVSNDLDVSRACLDCSIEDRHDQAPDTEHIPVDSSERRFASAGAVPNIRQPLATRDPRRLVLITDLGGADLGALRELACGEGLVGYSGQFWLLVATDLAVVPDGAQPLGMAPVA